MANNVLIIGEGRPEGLRKVSFEMVTLANRLASSLGGAVEGVVVGSGVDGWATALAASGVVKVFQVDEPSLAEFSAEAFAAALADVIRLANPAVVLLGATGWGKGVSARTAAKLDLGLVTDCTGVEFENGSLMLTRPIYAGKAVAHVRAKALPVIVSVRPNIFPAAASAEAAAPIETVGVRLPAPRAKVLEAVQEVKTKVDLGEANIVVSGGRGVKGPEGFIPINELADTLGAAVGSSRAAVDAGWIDYTHQVGQTGKTVSPKLYIAVGISGAIQHLAGMSSSKVVVAINKDPDAPIFKVADYGIVGDLFEVLPPLIQEFKKVLAEK
jgi:electron transfer flavoprotein alpha subunit